MPENTGHKNNVFTYSSQKYDSGIEDATIATTHMMLCAKSVGVDSCWVNCKVERKADLLPT